MMIVIVRTMDSFEGNLIYGLQQTALNGSNERIIESAWVRVFANLQSLFMIQSVCRVNLYQHRAMSVGNNVVSLY